ncbi:MAG: hypothetical protein AAFX99_16540, partial [Myxococcota bacterium]
LLLAHLRPLGAATGTDHPQSPTGGLQCPHFRGKPAGTLLQAVAGGPKEAPPECPSIQGAFSARRVEDLIPSGHRPIHDPQALDDNNNADLPEDEEDRAKVAFRRTLKAVAAERWPLAYQALKIARKHDPHDARMMAYEGWIIFNMPYSDQERQYRICREHLHSALTMQPDLAEAFYFLGRMAEERFEFEDAALAYHRAVTQKPGYTEARTRLKRLEDRGITPKLNPNEGQSLLKRLMSWLDR